jgi:hypothetical protein
MCSECKVQEACVRFKGWDLCLLHASSSSAAKAPKQWRITDSGQFRRQSKVVEAVSGEVL